MEEIISEIREQHRQRQDFQRAEQRLTLQSKALCRRICEGDKTEADKLFRAITQPDSYTHPDSELAGGVVAPLLDARSTVSEAKAAREKAMVSLVKKLPSYSWVQSVRGFGELGFAQIVGECGNLSNYPDKGHLFKRLGLALVNGERQRRVSDPQLALEHGYSPMRRSIIYVIGDSLIKSGEYYREIYLARMAREVEKAEQEGLIIATSTKQTIESWNRRGLPAPELVKSLDSSKHRGAGHIHNRAKRYMEKTLIRDLHNVWRSEGEVTLLSAA